MSWIREEGNGSGVVMLVVRERWWLTGTRWRLVVGKDASPRQGLQTFEIGAVVGPARVVIRC
jgi:hypothetical protein